MADYAHSEVLVSTDWFQKNLGNPDIKLVDVDSKAYDAGNIPGAVGFDWQTQLQDHQKSLDPKKVTSAYCRIGERSSHTWFVLKYLLGLDKVKNCDGSWTEYANLVGAPIEKA